MTRKSRMYQFMSCCTEGVTPFCGHARADAHGTVSIFVAYCKYCFLGYPSAKYRFYVLGKSSFKLQPKRVVSHALGSAIRTNNRKHILIPTTIIEASTTLESTFATFATDSASKSATKGPFFEATKSWLWSLVAT